MGSQQNLSTKVIRDVKFRVLIIGRANAGKTSILQRVCDTTDNPEIYSVDESGARTLLQQLDPSQERGEHNIEHELRFASRDGYVFHDSRGFEGGDNKELEIVQDFVHHKSREKQLKDRLHVIWYCIPMDNDRPELELKHFEHVCPDKNVPVIAVFTKYEQFRREVMMKLEDQKRGLALLSDEIESIFDSHYLANLRGSPPVVRLEKMHKPGQSCTLLLEKTADALSGNVVGFMLLSVQKDNLELNIRLAIKWVNSAFEEGTGNAEMIIKLCTVAFPSIYDFREDSEFYLEKNYFERKISVICNICGQ